MTYDDENIGRLVREVADEWNMPPVRLDQPTWRDRVARDRRGRTRLAGWLRPVSGALGLAIALTAGIALLAVLLRGPNFPVAPGPSGAAQGSTASPRASSTVSPSSNAASAAPSFPITGQVPSVTRTVVQLEGSQYGIVDVVAGQLNAFLSADRGSLVRVAQDGSVYCVCVRYSNVQARQPTHAAVTLERYTTDGKQISSTDIAQFDGVLDPRDGAGVPDEPEHVVVNVSLGADPAVALVGYSERQHPVWKSGVLSVSLLDGTLIESVDLPDATDGVGNVRRMTDAPRVVGAAAGSLIVGRPYYEFSPPDAVQPSYHPSLQAFLASATNVTELASASGCGTLLDRGGALSNGGVWVSCVNQLGQLVVQRIGPSGELIDSTPFDTQFEGDAALTAQSPDGQMLYIWDPLNARLTRFDVDTGESVSVDGAPQASGDLLTAIAQWLVPSAQSKVLLSAGVAMSPDGSHLYALGVSAPGRDSTGSTGIFDFSLGDSMSATQWQPTADFVSVAVSTDGRWVYAAGMPDVNAAGDLDNQPASISVFDASNGGLAQFSGSLGRQTLIFPGSVLN